MAWDVIFYATADGSVPGADFPDGCPAKVRGTILAVLDAVAAAPPPTFSGGGKWGRCNVRLGREHGRSSQRNAPPRPLLEGSSTWILAAVGKHLGIMERWPRAKTRLKGR